MSGTIPSIPGLVERQLPKSSFVNPQRLVTQDTVLGGALLKAGDIVWNVSWIGSNEPGGMSTGPRRLAFGFGHHLCEGMHLARLELRAMYEAWFEHIGEFALVDDGPAMGGGPVMHSKRLLLDLQPAN